MEQKTAVKKVDIQIYGAKRALKRPRQGSSDKALLSPPRAEAAAPSTPRPSYDRHMSRVRRGSRQTAQKHPLKTVLSRFGRIWGSFRALRNETARRGARLATVRCHFVGSERSMYDPWRSGRVSWLPFRSKLSTVTSDDVAVISGELARLAFARGGPRGEGGAPGHRASPFHRLRVIYGVPDASRELSFDICHQPLHQTTFR